MSVNYIDKSTGDLIRVAGQGKAEYGASTERKGDIVIPATTAGNFQTVNVVFAQAMPDNDYAVVVDEGGNTWAHCTVNVTNKTTTGFTLFFVNITAADAPQMTFKYRAFKLYTDTDYNNLLNNAVLTSDVTDEVTNGDMNPVTSNAVYDTLVNTTIIQSNVKRSITQSPTQTTWYSANLSKPTIPTGKRLVRWLAFTDTNVMAVSVCGYNGDVDNCILVIGDIMHEDTPLTFNIWWGAEVADL